MGDLRLFIGLKPSRFSFTLIELLVVIAVIAILVAILLPALSRSKVDALRVTCLGNQHHLQMAYAMYTDDNDGWFVSSNTGRSPRWVGNGDSAAANENGLLYSYVQSSAAYHCPLEHHQ